MCVCLNKEGHVVKDDICMYVCIFLFISRVVLLRII